MLRRSVVGTMQSGAISTGLGPVLPIRRGGWSLVVAMPPVLCFYPSLQGYFVKGIMLDAIKYQERFQKPNERRL